MVKKLLIHNGGYCHCEIIESVIVKYNRILNIDASIPIDIYLWMRPPGKNVRRGDVIRKNHNFFKKYIRNTYPEVNFIEKDNDNYDYYIYCTFDAPRRTMNTNAIRKYISHRVDKQRTKNPNMYFLTPLSKKNYFYADILPYAEKKNIAEVPIYIIQGNLTHKRRYYQLLEKILDETYKYKFIIKLVGGGQLPKSLEKYKDKIVLKNNLNFINYHKQFLNAYCILPLISKKTQPQYYTTTLTSTISYARGYNLKCLIDKDLQNIYNLGDVEIYNDINDIASAFAKTLEIFYKQAEAPYSPPVRQGRARPARRAVADFYRGRRMQYVKVLRELRAGGGAGRGPDARVHLEHERLVARDLRAVGREQIQRAQIQRIRMQRIRMQQTAVAEASRRGRWRHGQRPWRGHVRDRAAAAYAAAPRGHVRDRAAAAYAAARLTRRSSRPIPRRRSYL